MTGDAAHPAAGGATDADRAAGGATDADRAQVRGSSMLLVGRIGALALAFAAQVVTVRYLSRTDYGVLAYALSLVTFGESLSLLGLDRAVTRFIPIHDEEGDRDRVLGIIVMVIASVVGIGTAYVLVTAAFAELLAEGVGGGPEAARVLVLVAALGPLQGLDRLGTSLLSIYSNPRAILLRKYLLGPGLRLLAVLAVVGAGGGVTLMAVGYLVSGILGVVVYVWILVTAFRAGGHLRGTSLRRMHLPLRPVLAFALPLLTTDLVLTTMTSVDGVMVGAISGAEEVAALRAIQPIARLNQLVLSSFGILFTPVAARMFARAQHEEVATLYWTTAAWVAVLTFPIFAVTFGLAGPMAVAAFGSEYDDAGTLLALTSAGIYATAAMGFNGMVLSVYGRVREVVVLNLVAAAANIAINLSLIPPHGAAGAATATLITYVLHNALKMRALKRSTAVQPLDRRYRRPYAAIGVGTVVLVVTAVLPTPLWVEILVVAVTSIAVVLVSRRAIRIAEVFPEAARVPVLGRVIGR